MSTTHEKTSCQRSSESRKPSSVTGVVKTEKTEVFSPENTGLSDVTAFQSASELNTDRAVKKSQQSPQHVTNATAAVSQENEVSIQNFRTWDHGVDWGVLIWIVVIHVGLVFAPFTFTWQALALTLVLHWLTGGIGICLGFHRLFTHRSFETSQPVRWLIAWIGGLAGEGSVTHWVANHRKHHALSDQEGDPHSPNDGAWWSHMLWFFPKFSSSGYKSYNTRWAPDLVSDPVLNFLDRTFLLWHIGLGLMMFATGYCWDGVSMGLSLLVWGMFVRLVFVLHATWLVNSASHMWGYRNYETRDDSRNNWWVALITYGEGWHNNHHAYPRMARAGHRWWEFDLTFMTIRLLEKIGLFWNVVDGQHQTNDVGPKSFQ